MQDVEGADISKNEYLFHHLVAMFQTLALQQLGKLVNPLTGKMERDMQQARITIDMLQMVKDKTAGNLSGRERGLLDGVLTELQLNYVDELQREEPEREDASAAWEREGEQTEQEAEERETETAAPAPEGSGAKETEAAPPPPGETAKKRGARKKGRGAKARKKKSDPEGEK